MKIRVPKIRKIRGGAIIICLIVALILGTTLGAYIVMVGNQNASAIRSQAWDQSMTVAEAGVEEGMSLINKFEGTFNTTPWASTATADNWDTTFGANVYHMNRALPNGNYNVYVTNGAGNRPVMLSVGTANWSGAAGNLQRKVVVEAIDVPTFNGAMAAVGTIDLKGNNIATDSFDSADTNYSTGGLYDPAKRKAGGNVYTDGDIANSLNIGNANIMGQVKTGPPTNGVGSTISIGPNGSVGDVNWVSSGTGGIETNYSSTDMNVQWPDVVLPSTNWPPASTSTTNIGGVTYDYAFFNSGYYSVSGGGSYNIYVSSNANVNLKFTSSFSANNIRVAGTNASAGHLTIWMDGPSFTIAGNDTVDGGNAANLTYYGTPNNTSVSFQGNAAFTGTIYAPEASFTLGGGGKNTQDFIGSSITASVTMNGHFNFHFDENLRRVGPILGYTAISWREVP